EQVSCAPTISVDPTEVERDQIIDDKLIMKEFKKGDLVDVKVKDKKGNHYWYCATVDQVNLRTKRVMVKALSKRVPIYWRLYSHHRKCICKERNDKRKGLISSSSSYISKFF